MRNLIKVERARHTISQAELAEKAGVSRQSIHAIESGKFVPSTLLALKIASILETNVDYLFQLEEADWK